jgi:hypothetical protein
MIEEQNTRFAVSPRSFNNLVPDLARSHRASDFVRARIDKIKIGIRGRGVHKRVSHANGKIKIVELSLQ